MKRHALAASILSMSLASAAHATSVEGFSATSIPVRAQVGEMKMYTPYYVKSDSNTAPVVIDISATKTYEEAVATIRETTTDPMLNAMLENYPNAPTSQEGIEAFEALTGTSLPSDAEFTTLINFELLRYKYVGITQRSVYSQGVVTQTANKTIISREGSDGLSDIYECETSGFIPTTPATEQAACLLMDSDIALNKREVFNTYNGSYLSDQYLYTDLNERNTRYHNADGVYDLPLNNTLEIRSVAHRPFVLLPGEVNNLTKSDGDFSAFRVGELGVEENSVYGETGIQPLSFLRMTGINMFYDKVGEYGDRRLFSASPGLFIDEWNEREYPIKLKYLENKDSYGFIDNTDYLEVQETFGAYNKRWLALGYYGSKDLDVITPVIFDVDNERFIYLSGIALNHLKETTPVGFIDDVRGIVVGSLPDAFIQSFPDLPDDLSGFDIDPDITQEAYTALINERIVRIAISGAHRQAVNGEDFDNSLPDGFELERNSRWASNEFRFISESVLRAPYVSYEFTAPELPEISVVASTSELSSADQTAATITISASGSYQEVRASCRTTSTDAEVAFSYPTPMAWGMNSTSSANLTEDGQKVSVVLTAQEEVEASGKVMETTLTALNGAGEVGISCTVTGYDMFGMSKSRTRQLTFNVTTPASISGQFTADGQQLTRADIRTATVTSQAGEQFDLSIADDLSFTQPLINAGIYSISAQADGYVFPCSATTVTSGEADAGELTFLRGDLNGDGAINGSDVWRFYFRYFASGDFDVNMDGAVNNADLTMIRANSGAVQCEL